MALAFLPSVSPWWVIIRCLAVLQSRRQTPSIVWTSIGPQ